jgi:hypothetical protein
MKNPIPMAARFLRSLNYQPTITDTALEFQGTTVSVSPNAQSLVCTRIVALMPMSSTPEAARGAFLIPFIFNAVAGQEFDAAAFFDKGKKELLRSDRYTEYCGGIAITLASDAGHLRVEIAQR